MITITTALTRLFAAGISAHFMGTAAMAQDVTLKLGHLAVPCAFTSLEAMDAAAGGEWGDQIETQIIEKAGMRPLTCFAGGPRNLTSNRPVTTPDELNRLKMHVPNVPPILNLWLAPGAAPAPMTFGEVFTGLQNGTIEAQTHINKAEHVWSWIYLAISELSWAKLSPEDQAAAMEAGGTYSGV